MKNRELLRESACNIKARPIYSLIYGFIIFVALLAILIQYEQAQQHNADTKAEFNSPEYRTFSVQLGSSGFFNADDIQRLFSLQYTERVWGTSTIFDVTNTLFINGRKVGATFLIGEWDWLPIQMKWGRFPQKENEIILPYEEYIALGFDTSGGIVQNSKGQSWIVVGVYETDNKRFPRVGLLPPSENTWAEKIYVMALDGNNVQELSHETLSILGLSGNQNITIDKSGEVNKIGGIMQQKQADYVVLIILTILTLALLIGIFISILVVNSRKEEFGRRRVLGASRYNIFFLLISQTLLTVTIACTVASIAALIIGLTWYPQGIPNFWLLLSLNFFVIFIACISQIPSAFSAMFRNPVDVLRMP